ncbi:MAG TPA: hypothetical protein DEO88_08220 [Syntrophobacteraceae bacterium]|nr:hypothetical protein [Syntrophobacteraceae bacterium]
MISEMVQGHEGVASYHYCDFAEGASPVGLRHAVYVPVHFANTFWSIAVTTPERQILGVMRGFTDRWLGIIVGLVCATMVYGYSLVRAWTVLREERQRKQAEAVLRESEARFRLLYEDAPIGYQSLDGQGCLLEVNRAWLGHLGYQREEVIGRWFGDFLVASDAKSFPERFDRFKTAGEVQGVAFEMIHRDGHRLQVELDGRISRDEYGRFVQTHCTMRDVTQQRQAEQAIQALVSGSMGTIGQEFFDGIVQRLAEWLRCDGAVIGEIDENNQFTILSLMAAHGTLVHGRTYESVEVPGLMAAANGFSAYMENARESFPNDRYLEEYQIHSHLGTCLRDNQGRVLGVLCAYSRTRLELPGKVEEVMEILASKASAEIVRKRMEQDKATMEVQLRQAQKMEAIGTLAGGIAHDFNNILAAVIGYAELVQLGIPEGSPEHDNLQQVLKASLRAKQLVQQILLFSRQRGDMPIQPVAVGSVIGESLRLLRASLPSTIEIYDETDCCGVVQADPTQIQQILINLCTNAAHAMKKTGGLLTVRLADVNVNGNSSTEGVVVKSGRYVKLTVSDTGHGMESAVQERIFDPYFTTKNVGEGSGLGLAVVHGIVKRLDGAVSVASEPGKGTTFEVYLPSCDAAPERKPVEMAPIPTGCESVLWVDDDEVLMKVGEQMLKQLGYQVVGASSSREALHIFGQRAVEFDIVVTDFTMPQMTGMMLAEEILKLRSDIPIILCTGYSDQVDGDSAKARGVREFVMKPLALRELAEVIRRTLDDRSRNA